MNKEPCLCERLYGEQLEVGRKRQRTPRSCLILCEIFAFSLATDSSNRAWLMRCVVTFGLRFCRSFTQVKGSGVDLSSDPLPRSFQCRRKRLCLRRSVVLSQSTTGLTTQSGWFRLVDSGAKAVDISASFSPCPSYTPTASCAATNSSACTHQQQQQQHNAVLSLSLPRSPKQQQRDSGNSVHANRLAELSGT